jgi:DNA-binding GntR family transcriptional regulator
MSLSRQRFRLPIDHAVAHLVPVNASKRLAELFGMRVGSAQMVLEETFYSEGDQPLATAVVTLNSAFISLGVFRRFLK